MLINGHYKYTWKTFPSPQTQFRKFTPRKLKLLQSNFYYNYVFYCKRFADNIKVVEQFIIELHLWRIFEYPVGILWNKVSTLYFSTFGAFVSIFWTVFELSIRVFREISKHFVTFLSIFLVVSESLREHCRNSYWTFYRYFLCSY